MTFWKTITALSMALLLITGIDHANAQDDTQKLSVVLTFGDKTCTLSSDAAEALIPSAIQADGEATSDSLSALVLTGDCLSLIQTFPSLEAGTYWFSVTIPDDTRWLSLEVIEEDIAPPQIDSRGRYFGCMIENYGQQPPCRVLVDIDDTAYLIEIPLAEPLETNAIVVLETPPAQLTDLPDLTSDQQTALNELQKVAVVTVNSDGTLTATLHLAESSLNHTVDIYAPLAGYTADELNLDMASDGFTITADNTFLTGNPGRLVFHMSVISGNQTTVLRTDWANFNGAEIAVSIMQSYDPLINSVVLTQIDGVLNKSEAFDYTLSNITLSDTEMELVATLRFR